ncbi:MAG: ankyrin repeat domain-containing protein [Acidobacteriota bacterium]|nr:ankyrin repeat domain-containing protein [Acidobacteriota bacterium]
MLAVHALAADGGIPAGSVGLEDAIDNNDVPAARRLIDSGSDVNEPRLLVGAAALGRVEIVRMLIEAGAAVDAALPLSPENFEPDDMARLRSGTGQDDIGLQTPLSSAAFLGRTEIVEVLLKAGADPNIATAMGKPIGLAAVRGHLEVVRLLIDAGADLLTRPKNRRDLTLGPLVQAVKQGHTAVVELLVDSGAYPCREGTSLTVLDLALPGLLMRMGSGDDEMTALLERAREDCAAVAE